MSTEGVKRFAEAEVSLADPLRARRADEDIARLIADRVRHCKTDAEREFYLAHDLRRDVDRARAAGYRAAKEDLEG